MSHSIFFLGNGRKTPGVIPLERCITLTLGVNGRAFKQVLPLTLSSDASLSGPERGLPSLYVTFHCIVLRPPFSWISDTVFSKSAEKISVGTEMAEMNDVEKNSCAFDFCFQDSVLSQNQGKAPRAIAMQKPHSETTNFPISKSLLCSKETAKSPKF